MKPYTIEFVEHRELRELVVVPDQYKFKPSGRFVWLQRLAWNFLAWTKALEHVSDDKVTFTRHTIDADDFIHRIDKQKESLWRSFHKEGQRLLIGSEDYAELMNCSYMRTDFHFRAEICVNNKILGLTVEVIPWMRGMVVMD